MLSSGLNKIDLRFTDGSPQEYCDYCFDRVKNYDEEGVDCGGSGCAPCKDRRIFIDYIYYIKWILWILLLLLLLYMIYRNRDKIKEWITGRKHKVISKKGFRLIEKLRGITLPSFKFKLKFKKYLFERKIKRDEKREIRRERRAIKKQFRKEKRVVKREVRVIKRRIRKKTVKISEISDLRRKLNEWKRKGYTNTSKLQRKLDELEGRE